MDREDKENLLFFAWMILGFCGFVVVSGAAVGLGFRLMHLILGDAP